jgi:hypothetical protein
LTPSPGFRAALAGAALPLLQKESHMRKLTKSELRSVRTLANILTESGLSYEGTAYIVGMRLKYLGAFSISNLEQVFQVRR